MNDHDDQALDIQLQLLAGVEESRLGEADVTASIDPLADPQCVARLERNLAMARRLDQTLKALASPTERNTASIDSELPWKQLGRFQIIRELGRGGCGLVFLAHDPYLNREVALKVPRAEIAASPELRARFRQEARAGAALDHPNLVKILEAGEVGPVLFLVSEFAPGVPLDRWLAEQSSPVPCRLAAALIATLADAMEHAHCHGVLHRDLKPGNVIVFPGQLGVEGEPTPKIVDFGLARLASAQSSLTQTGAIMGTVRYMAPEQAEGRKELGPGVDIYALGVVLHELLTTHLPPDGRGLGVSRARFDRGLGVSPSPLPAHVPKALATICKTCLQHDSSRRYPSAAALAGDLHRFLADQPLSRSRATTRAKWFVRWGTVSVALAIITVLIAMPWWASKDQRRPLIAADNRTDLKTGTPAPTADSSSSNPPASDQLLQRGRALCEQADVTGGLLCLAHGLIGVPSGDPSRQATARASLAQWLPRMDFQLIGMFPHTATVRAVAFSGDGLRVATASDDWTVQIWNVATGELELPPLRHASPVQAIAFSPDGALLLTGCRDGQACFWDARTGQQSGSPIVHAHQIMAVAFHPSGECFLTGGWDKTARCWDLATRQAIGEPLQHDGPVLAAAFISNGQAILTGNRNQKAWLWDAQTFRPRTERLHHAAPVYAIGFDPTNSLALTAGGDGAVQFWDLATCSPRGNPLQQAAPVYAIGVSPDGELLVGGEASHCTRYRLADRSQLASLPQIGSVKAVAYSPDGRHVVVGGPRVARLWSRISSSKDRAATAIPSDWPDSSTSDPKQLLLWIEAQSGFELDERGQPRALDAAAWKSRRQLSANLSG